MEYFIFIPVLFRVKANVYSCLKSNEMEHDRETQTS